jgi:hypothetical protein
VQVDPAVARAAAVGELNALASLIGPPSVSAGDTFQLNLFAAQNIDGPGGDQSEVIEIDASAAGAKYRAQVLAESGLEGTTSAPQGSDDLLDLMDQA